MGKSAVRKSASDEADSSSDDDDLSRFAAVAVSGEQLAREQTRVALQGHHKLHKISQPSQQGAAQAAAAEAAEPAAGGPPPTRSHADADEGRKGDPPPLGIIEDRIATSLHKRLERDMWTWHIPSSSDTPEPQPASDSEPKPIHLGTAIRLFRRCAHNTPVLLPPEPEPTGSDGKRWLAADIKQAMTAKRIRAELRMLETAAQQCNGKQIPQHTHTLAAEAPDSTAGPTAGDAADAYQAAIQQAIKHLRAHQAEDKKQAKALRKALEQLAVDGSAILSQARGFTTPVDEATPEHPGRPRKKKKKKGAQDGSAETVPAEPLRKVDGTVIEARVDVPRDVRISKLLGTSTS